MPPITFLLLPSVPCKPGSPWNTPGGIWGNLHRLRQMVDPFHTQPQPSPPGLRHFYWFSSSSSTWALAPPHYHYLSGDSSLPLIKIYIATFIRWYNTVNRISSGSSSLIISVLTPASPVLVPVRVFKFKLNFNVAALMFEVELPSQEVAEDGVYCYAPFSLRNSQQNVPGKHPFSSRDWTATFSYWNLFHFRVGIIN